METYNSIEIIKKLKSANLSLFTLNDFGRLFNISNQNTLYKKIQRLQNKGIIEQLTKGNYLFNLNYSNDFAIANFIYQPSYVSLESALSFHGVIAGFPYQITSITTKKPKSIKINNKNYSYSKININLFWGYENKENFLIANIEKALFDYCYLAAKGLRSADFDEFDLSLINKNRFRNYITKSHNILLLKFIRKIKL